MDDKFQIKDESNDRAYFTIIPNYILNHSTANDQALYLQMKRYAGENGECFASERKLRKQLGIGVLGLKKSINYLLDHKWISHKGTKQVMTKGGLQDINVYVVNDIWKMNNDFYKGVPETTHLNNKGVLENEQRCSPNSKGGVLETATKKIHIKEDPYITRKSGYNPLGAEVIKLFESINPACKRMYGNKTQRKACDDLIETYGFEDISKVIPFLEKSNKIAFFPTITTPLQLWDKYQTLKDKIEQKKSELKNKNKSKVAF